LDDDSDEEVAVPETKAEEVVAVKEEESKPETPSEEV